MDNFLTYAIPLCALIAGLSSFFDKWSTYSQRPIFQGRPWINTAFLSNTWVKVLYFVFFAVISFILGKCNSDWAEKKTKYELANRDSAHQRHDDSLQTVYKSDIRATNDSNIKSFSKSLEEYNLAYNEQQKKVVSLLKDSMSREIPSLDVIPGERHANLSTDSFYINFRFTNTGNCPLLVTSRIYEAFVNPDQSLFVPGNNRGLNNRAIGIGLTDNLPDELKVNGSPLEIYLLVTGSYTNAKNKIGISIDNLFTWDIHRNTIGVTNDPVERDSIEHLIKKAIRKRK
jgi:hypothetical protein